MKNILDGRTDRGKTVYPPPPSESGGIKTVYSFWLTRLKKEYVNVMLQDRRNFYMTALYYIKYCDDIEELKK
jgi:hypothetical protein